MAMDEEVTKEEFVNNARRGLLNFRNDPATGALDEVQPRSVWRQRFTDARAAIAKLASDTKRVTKAEAERRELGQRMAEAGLTLVPKVEMVEQYDTALKNAEARADKAQSEAADLRGEVEALKQRLDELGAQKRITGAIAPEYTPPRE